MLISTALLLDSNIRNSVCTPAKLPCRRVEVGYDLLKSNIHICRAVLGKFLLTKLMTELTTMRIFKNETSYDRT
jgi:hypothetical protein